MSAFNLVAILIGLLILVGGGLAILGLFNVVRANDAVSERIRTYTESGRVTAQRITLADAGTRFRFNSLRFRLNTMLSALNSSELHRDLASANWPVTVAEYYLIRIGVTLAGFFLGWFLFSSPISGLGMGVVTYLVPGILLRRSIQQRQVKFQNQLLDVLVLISGAVRVGYSLLQSLDVVLNQMTPPASEEFRRVRREVELGLPLSQALVNLSSRMKSDDLYLAVTAININTQVGGNLTIMLNAVTQTIRERIRLFGEVRVLTSYARYSSYLLTMLPVVVTAILFILNPEYISRLFVPGPTLLALIIAIISVILGNIWIRLLARIDV